MWQQEDVRTNGELRRSPALSHGLRDVEAGSVETCVISADGTEVEEALRPDERGLLERIDAALKAHAGFCAAYPGAPLVRADSNHELRYQHQGGITQLWARSNGQARSGFLVDVRSGKYWGTYTRASAAPPDVVVDPVWALPELRQPSSVL
ncbi:hypothetical protein [Methylomagnum ishizawai]|uniref:hypothetical protein n=1 Tax=Methylomagnum ishizawai TaxID=1760988 RepID=UPI000F73E9BE|nr:hypothetical protein [Methylomagnum ishizawai]